METVKTNTGEIVTVTEVSQSWRDRALAAEKRLENLDLVLICAQDLVKMWPTVTIRTLGTVTKAIDTLRQALEASK